MCYTNLYVAICTDNRAIKKLHQNYLLMTIHMFNAYNGMRLTCMITRMVDNCGGLVAQLATSCGYSHDVNITIPYHDLCMYIV